MAALTIQTEPIGSIPRPRTLLDALSSKASDDPSLDPLYEDAIRDTIHRFVATESPVVTDGEQRKYHNFWTYPVHGLPNTSPDGFRIPFAAGHTRGMPCSVNLPRAACAGHPGGLSVLSPLASMVATTHRAFARLLLCKLLEPLTQRVHWTVRRRSS
jgi:hypothetical protein